MSEALFRAVGGKPTVLAGADPNDPANVIWNFGINPPTSKVDDAERMFAAADSLHVKYPKVQGMWDGKTTINHCQTALKVLGSEEAVEKLIQYQPRGTCGGRAGKFGGDFAQLIAISAGKPYKFKPVSHAAVYFIARKLYGMLEGRWNDENEDGVAHGAVPDALTKVTGYVSQEEDGDTNYYGPGSDDLACKLGAGLLPELQAKILQLGSDNKIEWARVTSAQEGADGLAAGGIIIGSDSQGFTMTRDSAGFCRPSGRWQHYHSRVSVLGTDKYPKKGFGYWQSWGRTTPGGNRLKDHPGNCFGVDWDTQDQLFRTGKYAVIFGFPAIEAAENRVDVNWLF